VVALFARLIIGATVDAAEACVMAQFSIRILPVPDVWIMLTGAVIRGLFLISVLIKDIYTLEVVTAMTLLI
jgi:hypothetical protein